MKRQHRKWSTAANGGIVDRERKSKRCGFEEERAKRSESLNRTHQTVSTTPERAIVHCERIVCLHWQFIGLSPWFLTTFCDIPHDKNH